MKLQSLNCPQCGELALGTDELTPGVAMFTDPDEDGNVEYNGKTKMDWEGQTTQKGPNGDPILVCYHGHEWEGVLIDEDAIIVEDTDGQ